MAEAKKTTKGAPKKKSELPKESPSRANTKTSAPQNESNQFWSILLFALGVLTALMVLIKGTKGWLAYITSCWEFSA